MRDTQLKLDRPLENPHTYTNEYANNNHNLYLLMPFCACVFAKYPKKNPFALPLTPM